MYVQAAETRNVQDALRNNLSEGGDDDKVRREISQDLHIFFRPDLHRLVNRDLVLKSQFLHRRRLKHSLSSLRLVRLGEYGGHFIFRIQKGLQDAGGKVRRSHKDSFHQLSPSSAASSSSASSSVVSYSSPSTFEVYITPSR